MKSIAKKILAIAVAGTFCLGAGALAACNKNSGDGKSAYEIAVDNGFEGTEQEWLDSLKTSVKDTDVTYEVDSDGNTVAVITITMSDDTQSEKRVVMSRRVVGVELDTNSAIWTAAQASAKSNQTGINWEVVYDDGSRGFIPATSSQILEVEPCTQSQAAWDGTFTVGKVYRVTYCFGAHWYQTDSLYVYICDDLSTIDAQKEGSLRLSNPFSALQINETLDVNTLSLRQEYDLYNKIQEDYTAAGDEYHYGYSNFSSYTPVTAAMLGAVDTSSVGYKNVTVTYNQKEYTDSIEVYDPSVTTVEYMYFVDPEDELPDSIVVTQGSGMTAALATEVAKFANKEAEVYYYVYTNGRRSEYITVTASMLDSSAVQNTPGAYSVTVTYKGYVREIPVIVAPDMSAATKTQTLTGNITTIYDLLSGGETIDKIELYDNGYAEAFSDDYSLAGMLGYLGYTLDNGTLTVKYNGKNIAIAKVTGTTFAPYEFQTSQLVKTYTGSVNMGATTPITLKTYDNGFAEFTMGAAPAAQTYVLGYAQDGDTITVTAPMYSISFTVGANDTITMDTGM
ncbi:MAG: hypothetical protein NC184_03805 [Roseburia sp.]|nr:hypothetical protein [Roseburia sp.]